MTAREDLELLDAGRVEREDTLHADAERDLAVREGGADATALAADDDTLDAIIEASDGVMVARGDLAVEIGDAELVGVQKHIIRRARALNRFVITATQMMESMIHSPQPALFLAPNAPGRNAGPLASSMTVRTTLMKSSPWPPCKPPTG